MNRNIALKIAYDGTKYHGFQRQRNVIAIQNILEDRLKKIFGEKIEMVAAGRTDAGVHALGQVVNCKTRGKIKIEHIIMAAKTVLPEDIVVREAWEAEENFNARYAAKSKEYIYRIQQTRTKNPLLSKYSWYVGRKLDVEEMKKALKKLEGEHDFSTFKAAGEKKRSAVRKMYEASAKVEENLYEEEMLTLKFHANGFLYHMVRNIVGSVVEIGRGRMGLEEFERIFEARDRKLAPPTAPAHGLCLYKVHY